MMLFDVAVLRVDPTRPETFNCTCIANCKNFTCCHSLGVAMLKGILHAPEETRLHLLGVKRKRGPKAKAKKALVRQRFNPDTPLVHPHQQELKSLSGQLYRRLKTVRN